MITPSLPIEKFEYVRLGRVLNKLKTPIDFMYPIYEIFKWTKNVFILNSRKIIRCYIQVGPSGGFKDTSILNNKGRTYTFEPYKCSFFGLIIRYIDQFFVTAPTYCYSLI